MIGLINNFGTAKYLNLSMGLVPGMLLTTSIEVFSRKVSSGLNNG